MLISTQELAQALGCSEQACRKKLKNLTKHRQAGSKASFYAIADLPDEYRQALPPVNEPDVVLAEEIPPVAVAEIAPTEVVELDTSKVDAKEIDDKARIKIETLLIWEDFQDRHCGPSGIPDWNCRHEFCRAILAGEIKLNAWLVENLPRKFSAQTLYNWEQSRKSDGLLGLTDNRGKHRRGASLIDRVPTLRDFILSILDQRPSWIHRAIQSEFAPDCVPSLNSLYRWIEQYQQENPVQFAAATDGKLYRNKYQPAVGSYSQGVDRPGQRIEIDSTRSDILLSINGSSGRRCTVIFAFDVFSRRGVFVACEVGKATIICGQLLRRIASEWGLQEGFEIAADLGKDFQALMVRQGIERLGGKLKPCTGYSPQQKPFVESNNGKFSIRLEQQAGYVGHSTAEREKIRQNRRLLGKPAEEAIEALMSFEEFVEFCQHEEDAWNTLKPHSGLPWNENQDRHETPMEAWHRGCLKNPPRRITDERALDVLLLPPLGNNKGFYIVRKGCLEIQRDRTSIEYSNPALWDWSGKKVFVLEYPDLSKLLIYEDASLNNLICVALAKNANPNLRADALQARKSEREMKKEVRSRSRTSNVVDISSRMRQQEAEKLQQIERLPYAQESFESPGFSGAQEATEALESLAQEVRASVVAPAYVQPEKTPQQQPSVVIRDESDFLAMFKRLKAGEAIAPDDLSWMRAFLQSPDGEAMCFNLDVEVSDFLPWLPSPSDEMAI